MSVEFPPAFVQRVLETPELGQYLLDALHDSAPVSVRCHPIKGRSPKTMEQKIEWCQNGIYLSERPSYVRDPLFHAGAYYPQEAGSMTLETVLSQLEWSDSPHVLDLCAAPGGKTMILGDFMKQKGVLVANEVIRTRASILVETTSKWGMQHVVVTNNDPRDFSRLPEYFDLVLVDAPCSGEGMFRKDPSSVVQWSDDNLTLCENRQKRILTDVWSTLKGEGYMVYSTCTFNPNENEEQICWLLENFDCEVVNIVPPPGALRDKYGFGYYCIPGKMKTEGFYCAVIRKRPSTQPILPRKHKQLATAYDLSELFEEDPKQLCVRENKVYKLSSSLLHELTMLTDRLKVLKFGTCLGSHLPKGFVPDVECALDASVKHCFPVLELNRSQSLEYLRGDTFSIEAEKGYVMVTFEGIPLGFIKHLGSRFNNLYPKSWRIRMRL